MRNPFVITVLCLLAVSRIGSSTGFAQEQQDVESNAFGTTTKSESALIGILYDLKQTQKRQPVEVTYTEEIGTFVRTGWDEGLLNKYFRVTRPLYTTQIFIPMMSAKVAPKAFGAERDVQPSHWAIHYKGQVSPPHAGTYRFVGIADDLVMVAINGQTVLIGDHPGARLVGSGWRKEDPRDGPMTKGAGKSINGDWFTVKDKEIVDIDIMIGECPGGSFGAWLLIEQEGVTYPAGPVLPAFQLAQGPIPLTDDGPAARAANPDEIWKAHQ